MVISGCPVDNNATIVSTCHWKVDYISRQVYCFKTVLDDCAKMNAVNNMQALPQATESTMNVDAATTITEHDV